MSYDHLRTWTGDIVTDVSFRLDLWDTGRTRDGKSELRYCLAIIPTESYDDLTGYRPVLIEGEEFYPSPLHAIDSDSVAAALLGFLAHDGETRNPENLTGSYDARQLEALQTHYEALTLWGFELDPDA